MKILHMLPGLYTGGGEKICIELCNELAKNKEFEVILCSLEPLNERQEIMHQKITPSVKLITLNKKGKSPAIFFEIIKMISSVKPDIIHTHLSTLHYAPLGIILSGIPSVHTLPTVAEKSGSKGKIKLYKFLFNYFNFDPVSMGDKVFQSCKNVFGKPCHSNIEIGTIPLEKTPLFDEVKNEIDALRKNENTKFFVSVGRLYPVKNQLLLIEAFQKLLKGGYDAHLFVIGSTILVPDYAKQCEELVGNNKNIHIVGEKSNVADYLLNVDALCFSSIYEGLPMTIVEGMSLGVPTIATSVGGIPDLINEGINGYLSADMSAESYVELFKKIIEGKKLDSEKIKDIFADKYSIKQCAQNYADLYKAKIANGK